MGYHSDLHKGVGCVGYRDHAYTYGSFSRHDWGLLNGEANAWVDPEGVLRDHLVTIEQGTPKAEETTLFM